MSFARWLAGQTRALQSCPIESGDAWSSGACADDWRRQFKDDIEILTMLEARWKPMNEKH
jgi:hypothetical protein